MIPLTILREFPNLNNNNALITSPRTSNYNCIAWAAGEINRNWWPGLYYWPPNIPINDSLEAFKQAFESLGYSECLSNDYEAGFEKIALFVGSDGKVKHAAKQMRQGVWSSKLGWEQDIDHAFDAVSGLKYGNVAMLMKRPDGTL